MWTDTTVSAPVTVLAKTNHIPQANIVLDTEAAIGNMGACTQRRAPANAPPKADLRHR